MPNRKCDFCDHSYAANPKVGYYKVSEHIKMKLNIGRLEDSTFDFICGDHFSESCFNKNGRLKRDAIPTMFPKRECLYLDHNYSKAEDFKGTTLNPKCLRIRKFNQMKVWVRFVLTKLIKA